MSKRNLVSSYYTSPRDNEPCKVNRAVHSRSATMRAFDHMQIDAYSARLCEVWDERTGTLHAVFKRGPRNVVVIFSRNPLTHQE